jgi:hypothetical protein
MHLEDITIISIHALNFIKHTLLDIKAQIGLNTITEVT